MGKKAVILEEPVDLFLYYYAKFYSPYSGRLSLYETYQFFRFLRVFFFTPGVSGVSLGSSGQGYELNINIIKRTKRRSFWRSAYFTPLLLCQVLQATRKAIVLVRSVSIFSFCFEFF